MISKKQAVNPSKWKVGTSFSPGYLMQISEIKEAGLDSIELVLYGEKSDLHIQGLRAKFNPYMEQAMELGLEVWSIHLPFGSFWDISTVDKTERNKILESHFEWLKWVSEWKVKRVVIHPSFEPILDEARPERILVCKQSLDQLAEKAMTLGIQICVEDLPRTCLGNTSGEMKTLIGDNEDLMVCCDVNHLLFESPVEFIENLGPRISTIHISDYDGLDEKHWMPGEGIIDWTAVIRSLVQIGYDGPFMFEVNLEDPKQMVACWKELLQTYKNEV